MDVVSDSGEEDIRVHANGQSDFADLTTQVEETSTGRNAQKKKNCESSGYKIQEKWLEKQGGGETRERGGDKSSE